MARTNLSGLWTSRLPVTPSQQNQLSTKLAEHDTALDTLESRGPIMVTAYGALDNNSTDNSDAIEAARTAAVAAGRGIHFPRVSATSIYRFSRTIEHPGAFSSLSCDPGVQLRHTGSGVAVRIDGGAVAGVAYKCAVSDVTIIGNAATTTGLHCRSVHHSIIRNVRVADVTGDALLWEYGVANVIESFTCSSNGLSLTTIPARGMHFTRRGSGGEWFTDSTIINPIVEGLTSTTGIHLDHARGNVIIGGTSESNGVGIVLTANSRRNRIQSCWFEANATADVQCAGLLNVFSECNSAGVITWQTGSYGNVLAGGDALTVTNSSAYPQRYDGVNMNGTLTDTTSPGVYFTTATLSWVYRLTEYASNAAAVSAGLSPGTLYRTGGAVMVVL